MPRVKGTRTIICMDCKEKYETIGWSTKRCPTCAEKHIKEMHRIRKKERAQGKRQDKDNVVYFYDSPEQIRQCLNCERRKCNDCMKYGGPARNERR